MRKGILKRIKWTVLFISLVLGYVLTNKINVMAENAGYVQDSSTAQTVTSVAPYEITTGSEEELAMSSQYNAYILNSAKQLIIPVTLNYEGVLKCDYLKKSTSGDYISLDIYSDETCQTKVNYNTYYKEATIDRAGVYYLKFSVPYCTSKEEYTVCSFSLSSADGRDKTISDNTWTYSYVKEYNDPIYYKATVSNSGIIKFDVKANGISYVTLCSDAKKEISDKCFIASQSGDQKSAIYGVKKGTYYFKTISNAHYICVKPTFTGITDTSQSLKKKATAIKFNSSKKGLLYSEDKTTINDWFKFTVTTPSKIYLVINANISSGKLRYDLMGSAFSNKQTGYLSGIGDSESMQLRTTLSEKLPKGVYYIRLYKDSEQTSGSYSVKVIKK